MADRYLLQVDQGHVYIWTETLRDKKGFMEISRAEAMLRIKKNSVGATKDAFLNEIDREIVQDTINAAAEEEVENEDFLDSADHVLATAEELLDEKNKALVAKVNRCINKKQVEDICLGQLGVGIDKTKSLSDIKKEAIEAIMEHASAAE